MDKNNLIIENIGENDRTKSALMKEIQDEQLQISDEDNSQLKESHASNSQKLSKSNTQISRSPPKVEKIVSFQFKKMISKTNQIEDNQNLNYLYNFQETDKVIESSIETTKSKQQTERHNSLFNKEILLKQIQKSYKQYQKKHNQIYQQKRPKIHKSQQKKYHTILNSDIAFCSQINNAKHPKRPQSEVKGYLLQQNQVNVLNSFQSQNQPIINLTIDNQKTNISNQKQQRLIQSCIKTYNKKVKNYRKYQNMSTEISIDLNFEDRSLDYQDQLRIQVDLNNIFAQNFQQRQNEQNPKIKNQNRNKKIMNAITKSPYNQCQVKYYQRQPNIKTY